MQCQYMNCTNIGVHSCSNCGLFVCGKHAHLEHSGDVVRCENCWSTIQQAEGKRQNRGCTILAISVGFAILGVILALTHAGEGGPVKGIWLLPVLIAIILFVVSFFHW